MEAQTAGRDQLIDIVTSGPYCSDMDGNDMGGFHVDCLLDAIPDNWAKIDGGWYRIEPETVGKDGEILDRPAVWYVSERR